MSTLTLHFQLSAEKACLDRSRFVLPDGSGIAECIRGTKSYDSSISTFLWTNAVKAFSLLTVKTKLNEKISKSMIDGEKGSLAASLDYAISKEPIWIQEMFGLSASGKPYAKRLFLRINSSLKRLGPVRVSFNHSMISRDNITIYVNGELAGLDRLAEIAAKIESQSKGTKIEPIQELKPDYTQLPRFLVLPIDCHSVDIDNCTLNGFYEELLSHLDLHTAAKIVRLTVTNAHHPKLSAKNIRSYGRANSATDVLCLRLTNESDQITLHFQIFSVDTNRRWPDLSFPYCSTNPLVSIVRIINHINRNVLASSELNLPRGGVNPLKPDHYEIYLRCIGLVHTNRRTEFEVAMKLIENVFSTNGTNPFVLGQYSLMLWRSYFSGWGGSFETLEEAKSIALRALQIDENCTQAINALVRLYWDSGEYRAAVKLGLGALHNNSKSNDNLLTFVRALLNAGDAKLALRYLQSALAYDPQNLIGFKLEIWISLMLKRYSDTTSLYKQYRSRVTGDTNTVWAAVLASLHLQRTDDAISLARSELELEHCNPLLWTLLGFVFKHANDLPEAEECWTNSLDSIGACSRGTSRNYRLDSWRAMNLALLADRSEAIKLARSLEAASCNNSYILNRIAHVYACLDDHAKCGHYFKLAAKYGFSSWELTEAEEITSLQSVRSSEYYQEGLSSIKQVSESILSEVDYRSFSNVINV